MKVDDPASMHADNLRTTALAACARLGIDERRLRARLELVVKAVGLAHGFCFLMGLPTDVLIDLADHAPKLVNSRTKFQAKVEVIGTLADELMDDFGPTHDNMTLFQCATAPLVSRWLS